MEECYIDGETQETNTICIDGIYYSYLITKSEQDKNSLIIKLYDSTNKSNIYYTYEGNISKIKKDIKYFEFCKNLNEIITCLNDIFDKGNAKLEKNSDEFYLNLKYISSGFPQYSSIQLIKHEEKNEIKDTINKLENNYKDLYNKYEELKSIKENEIRNIVKEVIFDKDIKLKIFKDMEQIFLSKYNLNNISKNQNPIDNIENNIMNKVKEVINNKEDKINNKINLLQKQLNENINYLKNIKSNNNSSDNDSDKMENEDGEEPDKIMLSINNTKDKKNEVDIIKNVEKHEKILDNSINNNFKDKNFITEIIEINLNDTNKNIVLYNNEINNGIDVYLNKEKIN